MSTAGSTIRSIQALRGIAALGVMASHLVHVERKYSGEGFLLSDVLFFGVSGVDLFFVISGFVMVTVTRDSFGGGYEALRFLWSRVTRIYPNYWVYFLLTLSVFLVMPGWVNASQNHQVDLWKSFFLLPDEHLPLVAVGWSLIHELWFYGVFASLLLFRRALLPALLGWAFAIVVLNISLNPETLSPALRLITHPYTLEFIAGALVALLFFSGRLRSVSSPVIMAFAIAAVAGLVLVWEVRLMERPDLIRATAFGVLFSLLILACVLLEQRHGFPFRWMQMVGDWSYTLYLSHVLVLSALGRLWVLLGDARSGPMDNVIVLSLMVAATLLYAWLAYRFIERPLVDWSHRIRDRRFGNRSLGPA